ncbi:hypothetical protein H6768_06415 [Candidatus Peribacteria bacterium]|nr:hypothetical protein [Candidatus Peribacteria bacterium]
MLRTIAYIIFLCTGIFAFFLVVLFFRTQSGVARSSTTEIRTPIVSTSVNDKVLSKVEKAYKFRKSSQNDVFGAFIFNFPVEITVSDRIRMYVFENDYALIRRNLLLLSAMYNFQDTTDFFGKTMFLNDKTGDGQIVRFITEIDGHAV